MSNRITSKKVENGVVFDYTQHCISPSVSKKCTSWHVRPLHSRSLIRIFEGLLGCQASISLGRKLRLWSDCRKAQIDSMVRCMDIQTCTLCWILAQAIMSLILKEQQATK